MNKASISFSKITLAVLYHTYILTSQFAREIGMTETLNIFESDSMNTDEIYD